MRKIGIVLFLLTILFGCTSNENQPNFSIENIEQLSPIDIYIDTEFNEIDLPNTVKTTSSDGAEMTIAVDWDETTYNTYESGIIEGVLILSDAILNPLDLIPTIPYTILPNDIMTMLDYHDFAILKDALVASGVDAILSLEGPFTLFAPSDAQFEAFFEVLDIEKDTFLARDDLADFLLYHVLSGNYTPNILIATIPGDLNTLEGSALSVNLTGVQIELNQTSKVIKSIQAQNGWIHEIDRILISQTRIENVFEEDFLQDILEMFMEVDIPLDILLSGSITLFLPNEDAFNQLLRDLDVTIEAFTLLEGSMELLSYHIFAGQYLADDLYLDAPINIRNIRGDLVRVDVIENRLMIKDARVESTEILGDFVVIHMISEVLIPPDLYDEWFNQAK